MISCLCCKTCEHLITDIRLDYYPPCNQYLCGKVLQILLDNDGGGKKYISDYKKEEDGLEPHYIGFILPPNKKCKGNCPDWCPLL